MGMVALLALAVFAGMVVVTLLAVRALLRRGVWRPRERRRHRRGVVVRVVRARAAWAVWDRVR